MKSILFFLFFYIGVAHGQIGGTQAETDTMRLADKFAVYKVAEGQRLSSSKVEADSIYALDVLEVPISSSLPTCDASQSGNIMLYSVNNGLYFCDGSAWGQIALDQDEDGLTPLIDTDDNTPFTAGTATAGSANTGKTFYTGSNMTYTTGALSTITQNITPAFNNTYLTQGYHSGSGVVYAVTKQGQIPAIGGNVKQDYGPYANCDCGNVDTGGVGFMSTLNLFGNVIFNGSSAQTTYGYGTGARRLYYNDRVEVWNSTTGQYHATYCQ